MNDSVGTNEESTFGVGDKFLPIIGKFAALFIDPNVIVCTEEKEAEK
ncbi:MAG: hypothetical protein HQL01_09010 [Nitrospirae bacterium]|nr:hypothetical protein [Nitrospirota bacterium]